MAAEFVICASIRNRDFAEFAVVLKKFELLNIVVHSIIMVPYIVDLVPGSASVFLRFNPSIAQSIASAHGEQHSYLLEYLKTHHRRVLVYETPHHLRQGDDGGMLIGLVGVRGFFELLPDRYARDGDSFNAMKYINRQVKTSGDPEMIEVGWVARHVSGDVPRIIRDLTDALSPHAHSQV